MRWREDEREERMRDGRREWIYIPMGRVELVRKCVDRVIHTGPVSWWRCGQAVEDEVPTAQSFFTHRLSAMQTDTHNEMERDGSGLRCSWQGTLAIDRSTRNWQESASGSGERPLGSELDEG